ncbi:MAG TPA: hypothetical protein VFI95_22200 [Terriglobales bacterium]|nr:hypothetical protein [Terriglobales bacterium]
MALNRGHRKWLRHGDVEQVTGNPAPAQTPEMQVSVQLLFPSLFLGVF